MKISNMPIYNNRTKKTAKVKKEEQQEALIIENNTEDGFSGKQSGKYKYLYTELIYKTLYDVVCGIPIKQETNFSLMLKRSLEHSLNASHTVEINNLIKLLISACPSRIYEDGNIEERDKEHSDLTIDEMFSKFTKSNQ